MGSCSFHPHSVAEKVRLVVDDKCLHNCSRETRSEEKADRTQQYRVLSGLSQTCSVTFCSEICCFGTVTNLWKNLILSVSIPLCFINVLDLFITVNTTNNWL
jgi:hypothetical protein